MTEQELAERKLDEKLKAKEQEQLERYNRRTGANCSRLGYYESVVLKHWDDHWNDDRRPTKDLIYYLGLVFMRSLEFYVIFFVVYLPCPSSWVPQSLGIALVIWLVNRFFRKRYGLYILNFAPSHEDFLKDHQQWLEDPDKFYDELEERLGSPVKRLYPSEKQRARFLKARAIVAS